MSNNFATPSLFHRVANKLAADARAGTYVPGKRWKKYSEEWYWDMLLNKVPFRSIYADEPGSRQPLIYTRSKNLSQTPREQCELLSIVSEGLELEGPGQVGPHTAHCLCAPRAG